MYTLFKYLKSPSLLMNFNISGVVTMYSFIQNTCALCHKNKNNLTQILEWNRQTELSEYFIRIPNILPLLQSLQEESGFGFGRVTVHLILVYLPGIYISVYTLLMSKVNEVFKYNILPNEMHNLYAYY